MGIASANVLPLSQIGSVVDRWFALFPPLYQIDGLVLFRGDRQCYGSGFGMGFLHGGSMVVCGGAGLLGL